jgi:hypothetical protein
MWMKSQTKSHSLWLKQFMLLCIWCLCSWRVREKQEYKTRILREAEELFLGRQQSEKTEWEDVITTNNKVVPSAGLLSFIHIKRRIIFSLSRKFSDKNKKRVYRGRGWEAESIDILSFPKCKWQKNELNAWKEVESQDMTAFNVLSQREFKETRTKGNRERLWGECIRSCKVETWTVKTPSKVTDHRGCIYQHGNPVSHYSSLSTKTSAIIVRAKQKKVLTWQQL